MKRTQRLWLILVALTVTVGMVAWLITSVGTLHDRVAETSRPLAIALVVLVSLTASAAALMAVRLLWKLGRDERAAARAPDDVIVAADVQAEQAELVVAQVRDEAAQARLRREMAELRADRQARRFHVVVFGTGSAGKTSLINALLGRSVGRTEATIGTTKAGEAFTYELEDVDGLVLLTDTPGLSEVGEGGPTARPRPATSPPGPTCSCSWWITT